MNITEFLEKNHVYISFRNSKYSKPNFEDSWCKFAFHKLHHCIPFWVSPINTYRISIPFGKGYCWLWKSVEGILGKEWHLTPRQSPALFLPPAPSNILISFLDQKQNSILSSPGTWALGFMSEKKESICHNHPRHKERYDHTAPWVRGRGLSPPRFLYSCMNEFSLLYKPVAWLVILPALVAVQKLTWKHEKW